MTRAHLWTVAALLGAAACTGDPLDETQLFPITTSVGGFVFDRETGLALGGATVRLEAGGQGVEVQTDSVGVYFVEAGVERNLDYTVTARMPGYEADAVTVRTAEGAVVFADLGLRRARPVLAVAPLSLDFGATTERLALSVRNDSTEDTTLEYRVAAPAGWLVASAEPATLQGAGASAEVEIAVDRAALGDAYGPRSALMAVVSNGGTAFVEARLEHPDPDAPRLEYPSAVIDLGEALPSATVTLRNTGSGVLSWSAAAGAAAIPWIQVSPESGDIPAGGSAELTLGARRESLRPGEEADAFLAIASNTVIEIALPLRLHIASPHRTSWEVDRAVFDLEETRASDVVVLRNTGSRELDWSATVDAAAAAWLTVIPAAGRIGAGAELPLSLVIDRDSIAIGDFVGSITLSSAAGTQRLTLGGRVIARPVLETSRSLHLSYVGERLIEAPIVVNNAGTGEMAWRVTSDRPWLRVRPQQGTAPGAQASCGLNPQPGCGVALTVTADVEVLALAGRHDAAITVTAGAQERRIPVTVDVFPYHWREREIPIPQAARRFTGGLAHDPLRRRFVVFGGSVDERRGGSIVNGRTAMNDTWELIDGAWTQIETPTLPPIATTPSLAYDRARGVMVMIGAPDYDQLGRVETTWEYDGRDWRPLPGARPPVVSGTQSLAWDEELGGVVAWGWNGEFEQEQPRSLWLLQGGAWTRLGMATPGGTAGRLVTLGGRAVVVTETAIWQPVGGLLEERHHSERLPVYGTGVAVDPADGSLWTVGGAFAASQDTIVGTLTFADAVTGRVEALPLPLEPATRWQSLVAVDETRRQALFFGGRCEPTGTVMHNDVYACATAQLLAMVLPGDAVEEAPLLSPGAATLDFGTAETALTLTLSNTGTGLLDWVLDVPVGFSATPRWGRTAADASAEVSVRFTRIAFPPGVYGATLRVRSDGGDADIDLQATVD